MKSAGWDVTPPPHTHPSPDHPAKAWSSGSRRGPAGALAKRCHGGGARETNEGSFLTHQVQLVLLAAHP